MATEKIKNLAASIRQKLLNLAKKRGDDFDAARIQKARARLAARPAVVRRRRSPEPGVVRQA